MKKSGFMTHKMKKIEMNHKVRRYQQKTSHYKDKGGKAISGAN